MTPLLKDLKPHIKEPSAFSRRYNYIEVNNKHLENMFLQVPEIIYRNDLNWIPQVSKEIAGIFNKNENPYFKHGSAARWIILNESGGVSGRIAAFINFEKMHDENKKIGNIGFFECINDQEPAFLLFDIAIKWLVNEFHVEAVDGPVNFGENDKYWGLLLKGFTPASYGMNYNPPYYASFFENYGFQILYKQFTNFLDLKNPLPDRFARIAERIISNDRYFFEPFRYKEKEKFIHDFVQIYNLAWASFRNFNPMDEEVVRKTVADMRSVMEEDFIWFAYADNKPAGFLMGMPDVNDAIKFAGPKLNWWGKCKFMFYKYFKGFIRVRVIVMGVVPEFQRHGLESALIFHAFNEGRRRPNYKHVELAWVGDFNEKMISIHKAMGAKEGKQHATFRKIINRI